MYETLKLYFDGECEIFQGSSGMNNLTRFIRHDEKDYVMRVYQNHADLEVVEVEQAVLSQLQELSVPKVVKMKDGQSIAKVGEQLAVVFEFMPGKNLKLETPVQYMEYGKLVGKLSRRLKEVNLSQGRYLPYYKLKKAYPDALVSGLVAELMDEVQIKLEVFKKLPHQLIHGDINCSNMLMDETGMPCAILDFEFVTYDLRAMETAICLSELLHEENKAGLRHFCEGFKSEVSLTAAEIEMMPWLIRLRRLDVVLHFLGRQARGIESENVEGDAFLQKQMDSLKNQHEWLLEHGEKLKEYLR